MAQMVKNLPIMQETWVRPLGQEELLEKKMATHSSIPAWRIPWTEEPSRLLSVGLLYVNPNSFHLPPPASTLGVHTFILCACVYFCFANRFIYTIFLDPTYMH